MWYFWPHPSHGYSDVLNCDDGYHDWENLWTEWHQKECCSLKGRGCPEEKQVIDKVVHVPVFHRAHNHYVPVPVPSPPHIVYKNRYVHLPPKIIYEHPHHEFHYDCHGRLLQLVLRMVCTQEVLVLWPHDHGMPWHLAWQLPPPHSCLCQRSGTHAHGRIYDCNAGFSNWMQGWSGSKKDWCCSKHNKGCVKFHCSSGAVPLTAVDF